MKSLPAILKDPSTIGKNCLAIMEEWTVSIQAPIFLAEELHHV
jgi:hypothetical protein